MKTLYIECNMGAAGDMLMGALSEIAPREAVQRLTELDIPHVEIEPVHGEKCGIGGTHMQVRVNGIEEHELDHGYDHHHHHDHDHDHHHHGDLDHEQHHHEDHDHSHDHHEDHHHHHDHEHGHGHDHHHSHVHHGMEEIRNIIAGLDVSESVKNRALGVYEKIAKAESAVHGEPMEHIHFHEVGSLDAVADVVGNCFLLDAIHPDRIIVSPLNVGSGTVRCAHGLLPVPAPATAEILKGFPYYSGDLKGELLTPTGAAILTTIADEFGNRPLMTVTQTGVGIGTRDYPTTANVVRVFLGEEKGHTQDEVCELSANIDDMTGEELGFAMEELLAAGARDVYYTPIMMKKNRPAVKLSVICGASEADRMAEMVFKHTTTVGIRKQDFVRYTLERSTEEKYGIRFKICRGYGTERRKAEYDDLAARAREENKSLFDVREELK